ncbi:MerR family transcriptional regulator [Raoultibacter phocaeensis]|uniref:MerR family transcriptional regulator n=1 Tax=Raoultibacter phocaeensis TaxID=2479841 RepID=UPI0011191056|nr:MerR family transcriptional regulator [Raoultibacter phocaeensis]
MFSESPNTTLYDDKTAKRYDIKDAARYLDIAPSTLRYWESEGLVRSERNPENDYRQYSLHSLIDASEIAFYRQIGVPVKELKHYHALTVDALDEALERTEASIERRMAELAASRERLAKQRGLNAQAEALRSAGMRPRTPSIDRLVAIEYDNPLHWMLLVDEPWRYGLFIDAADPDTALEGIVEGPAAQGDADVRLAGVSGGSASSEPTGESTSVLWECRKRGHRQPSLECLLRIAPYGSTSNVQDLLSKASQRGINPTAIVATYLVTGAETSDGPRWDYYHAWIIGDERDNVVPR